MTMEELRRVFPWPNEKPLVAPRSGNMFRPETRAALGRMLKESAARAHLPVVELGSWVGDSAEWLLQQESGLFLLCVDTWLGSNGNKYPIERYADMLERQYEAFQSRLWPHRSRCLAMRADTMTGLRAIYDHHIEPRFVYVDAGHESWGVYADVAACLSLFPGAPLVGDDSYPGNTVDVGVSKALAEFGSGRVRVHEPPMWTIS